MREKFSLPENYYEKAHQTESEDAVVEFENPETSIEGIISELGFDNLEIQGEITPEQFALAKKTVESLKQLSDAMSKNLLSNVDRYCDERSRPKEKVLNYILQNRLDKPFFTLISGVDQTTDKLDSLGYGDVRLNENNLLVLFNLPKQMAKNWWKGGADSSNQGVAGDYFLEWGKFYRDMMPLVWGFIDYMWEEGEVAYERINGIGEHDPENFYYIWEAWENDAEVA